MASNTCLRRIAGTPQAIQSTVFTLRPSFRRYNSSPFSTTSALLNVQKKKTTSQTGPPKRGEKALRLRKSGNRKTDYKRPAVGERKALRKRIVLSNTNALEVPDLKDLDVESLQDPQSQGKVLGLPDTVVDSLRAVDAFKPRQGWYYFRRPATLMRKETMELLKLLNEVDPQSGKKTIRRIITGERLSGQSTLLLQGMAAAFLKGWVVINLPDTKDIVNGHTEYSPLEGSDPVQFIQPVYTASLLSQIKKANSDVLAKLPLKNTHGLPLRGTNLTLNDLAEYGSRDPDVAWPAFIALWTELTQPGAPPILLAVDGLAHIMNESAYLAPDVKKIHAHNLLIVNHYVSYLSGARSLPNGGAVLAATSGSNQPSSPAMDYALKCAEMRAAGVPKEEIPLWDPYRTVDARSLESLRNAELLKLQGLSKQEARSIMEYYAASGMLRAVVNEGLICEKWTLSGGGNIGELERGAVRMRV